MVLSDRNPNTRRLAEWIAGIQPGDLPSEVRNQAGRALMDAIGCAFGGRQTEIVTSVERSIELQGTPAVGVLPIGGTRPLPAPFAALVNGFAINALDYDDTYEDDSNPISHPGSSTVGAALALAPDIGARDLLTAIVAGYETAIRVALAVQPTQERRNHVWGIGPHQVFGAAAASCKLLNLSVDQTVNALGLSGVHTSLPSVWTAAGWLKDAVGWPTMTGLMATYLAKAGYAGPSRIFDGQRSYFASVASDQYDPELLLNDLGTRWRFLDLSFKPYPACRWIHPVLDGLKSLCDSAHFTPSEVSEIVVSGIWELEKLFLRYEPRDVVDAQFSLPYTCAQVLLGTPPGPAWFEAERMRDPAVIALGRRVKAETDPDAEAMRRSQPGILRTKICVQLKDGAELKDERHIARGNPRLPLSDDELTTKFVTLARPLLGDQAEIASQQLRAFDGETSAAEVLRVLTPSAR